MAGGGDCFAFAYWGTFSGRFRRKPVRPGGLFGRRFADFGEDFGRDRAAAEVDFPVALPHRAQHAAGVADRNDVIGQVMGDDAAGPDDDVVADRDAGQDDRPRAKPAVTADAHRHIELIEIFPQGGQNRMGAGRDRDVGADHRVIADIDRSIVHKGEVKIDIDAAAQVDKLAGPVGVQRRLDVAAGADLGEHLAQKRLTAGEIGRVGVVELELAFEAGGLLLHERLARAVQVAVVHFFMDVHRDTLLLFRCTAPL